MEARPRPRRQAASEGGLDLLAWGRRYLGEHFSRPFSNMHRWLAGQLDAMSTAQGMKLNVLAPRGGAKSTIGTLAFPLRACAGKPRAVHLDHLRHAASGLRAPGEHQGRTAGKRGMLGGRFSRGGGPRPDVAFRFDRAPQRRRH